jgi:hypothetical protein
MCEPVSMTLIAATALAATATAVQGFNAAAVQRYNARQELKASQGEELLMRDKASRTIADQTLALANSGANPDTGTPLLLLGESARNAELDALAVRQTGRAKADGLEMQARGSVNAGLLGAGAQLLGGAVKLQQLGALQPPANSNTAPASMFSGGK